MADRVSQPAAGLRISSAVPQLDCPNDRFEFYRTFSTLIRLGSAPKKEKEPKGGVGLLGGSPYSRQMSSEQELWRTHLCDLIWFELQAYINVRTNKDQDDFLCKARKGIDKTLERVMHFSANTGENSKEGSSTNDRGVECFCRKKQSGYSGKCLQSVIQRQREVAERVTSLLDAVENVESLYPTRKALSNEHKLYAEDTFEQRIATLCLWMTITRDIACKIKLMAEVADVCDQSFSGTAWSCIDLQCLRTLAIGYTTGQDAGVDNDSFSMLNNTNDEDSEVANLENSSDCSLAASGQSHVVLRQKSVHFEDEQSDAQSRSERRHGRISRPNSTEATPTSIYRLYVDALLKKTGLRKLLARLKELLDTTLQRARLALLPAGYNCRHGISNVSKVII